MTGFALTPLLALRLICGLFFIPHVVGKFTNREVSCGFFRAAGMNPAPLFLYLAMILEVILAVMLVAGFHVQIAAWIACLYLLVAAAAVLKVTKKWLWHIGGCEYPLFWAISCGILATLTP